VKTKQITITARVEPFEQRTGNLMICPKCEHELFYSYSITGAVCGCADDAMHFQCGKCGTTFCQHYANERQSQHALLDRLVGEFIEETGGLPSQTTAYDLLKWSFDRTAKTKG